MNDQEFTKYVQENAYYDVNKEIQRSEIGEILKEMNLEQFSQGHNTRVYLTHDKKWVVKEGRWDLSFSMFKNVLLKFTPAQTKQLTKLIDIEFTPTPEVARNQFKDYLTFVEYFGYFDSNHPMSKAVRDLAEKQRSIRMKLDELVHQVKDFNSFPISDELISIISDVADTNFLADEYLLYGTSLHPKNEGKDTSFIIQRFVEGELFHDQPNSELNEIVQAKLLLLAVLILLMDMITDKVPDMRPRYFIQEGREWFSQTDNIILNNTDVFYIDTRWLWDKNANIAKRGVIIPEMTIESAKGFIYDSFK